MKRNRSKGRNIHGILILDKPVGITSNNALQTVKNLYQARKAGHTGSLDPLASGMLPICFGEATKFSQFLLNADKRYLVVAKLGVKTTTGDAEGEVVATKSVSDLSTKALEAVLDHFRGTIMQIPSMYSAIKYRGQPLYRLARQGIEVERKAREITIHELVLLDHTENTFTVEIVSSKGTYVRTLIEDIGEMLGCGAHVAELRRLMVGPYRTHQMISINELEELCNGGDLNKLDQCLLSVDTSVQGLPILELNQSAAFYMLQGQAVLVPNSPAKGLVRLSMNDKRFLGVGEILDDGRVAPRRLVQRGLNIRACEERV